MPFFTGLTPNTLGEYLRDITFPNGEGMGGVHETAIRKDTTPLTTAQVQTLLFPPLFPDSDGQHLTLDEDDQNLLAEVLKTGKTAQFEHHGFKVHMVNWHDGDATLIFGIFDDEGMLLHLENMDAKKKHRWHLHTPDPKRLDIENQRCWTVFHPIQGQDVREQFVGVFTDKFEADKAAGNRGYSIESTLNPKAL